MKFFLVSVAVLLAFGCFTEVSAQGNSTFSAKNCTNCGIDAVVCGFNAPPGDNQTLWQCAQDYKDCVDAQCAIPTTAAPTTTESCESIVESCGVDNCVKKGHIKTRCFLKCLFPYTDGDIPNDCAVDCILAADHDDCLRNCAKIYTCSMEPTTPLA
eukprot:m.65605 g.65605  ORF g.65605 m.65605 type:complete len:156 (-) comp19646_c0_seq2:571-1038(-)